MNRSTPSLPVHHHLPELTQTHVHRVCDAIQPSHPQSSPSPTAPNPSQLQSLFQRVSSSHEVAKVLEFHSASASFPPKEPLLSLFASHVAPRILGILQLTEQKYVNRKLPCTSEKLLLLWNQSIQHNLCLTLFKSYAGTSKVLHGIGERLLAQIYTQGSNSCYITGFLWDLGFLDFCCLIFKIGLLLLPVFFYSYFTILY